MTPSSILSATEQEHALIVYLKTNQTFVYVQSEDFHLVGNITNSSLSSSVAAISVLIFHISSTFNIEV